MDASVKQTIATLLYNASKHLVAKLQKVQNGDARIIVRLGKHEHMSPVLKEIYSLYWLLRIVYKINFLTFKCIRGLAPWYLQELLDCLQV